MTIDCVLTLLLSLIPQVVYIVEAEFIQHALQNRSNPTSTDSFALVNELLVD